MATSTGTIGIDLGSNNIVIAVAKRGGVEILANEGSHRETQNVVGFSGNERFVGEQAVLKFKSNFKNTITNANRFLGLKADCPFIKEEYKHLYSTIVPGQDNRLSFEVLYMGEKRQFLPEQIVAMVLTKVKSIIKFNGITQFDVVLSVPSYYTEQERKALLDATKIAELKTMALLNEHTATALNYGIFRSREFDENQRFVAFVDFGHTKTSAYVVSFTKEKMKVIAQVHDRNLGARDMDLILYEFYLNMFEKANSVSIRGKDKQRMKLLEAIEKQRKVLSANSEGPIHLECLLEDYDLNHVLPRAEFEKMIVPVLEKVKGLLNQLASETKEIKLHSVEIVGGATRIPAIQKAIEEAFRVESVSKTLNASECIARGCALQAAILSPLFKVAEYGVEDINYYPLRCTWKFHEQGAGGSKMEIEDPKQTSILFEKGCTIPKTKSLNFHRTENVELLLTYDPVPPGADELVASYMIQNRKPTSNGDYNVKICLRLNENGIVNLESAGLAEEFIEEIKEPIAQPKPAEGKEQAMSPEGQPAESPQFEIKKKKRTVTTDLKSEGALIHQFNEKQIHQFYEEEVRMANNDRVIAETHDRKNDLEAFIYNTRQHLQGGIYAPFTTQEDAAKIIEALSAAETWLYGEGAQGAKSVFISKLDDLKNLTDAIVKRYKEHEFIPENIQEAYRTIMNFENVVTSTEEKYSHINPEERAKVQKDTANFKEYVSKTEQTFKSHPKHVNLPVTAASIKSKIDEYVKNNAGVINKPKPAPEKAAPADNKGADANKGGEKKPEGTKMETEQPPKDGSKMDIEK